MVALTVVVPFVVSIIAIVTFLLIFWSFYDKPWRLKIWLLLNNLFWIPWAIFTFLMRIADSQSEATWMLRISFISSMIAFYSAYRFHHAMVFKPTDNRFQTFSLAILMGFNIALSFNAKYLEAVDANGYWVDQFHPVLMLTNILYGLWATYWVFKGLNEMDAFSLFYDYQGQRNTFTVFAFGSLLVAGAFATIAWFVQDNPPDATPFIIIIGVALAFFARIYGFKALTTILAPQRIWSFLMVNDAGLPVFTKNFSKSESIGELSLFAMALTASNTTIMENLQSDVNIDEISLEDRTVIIEAREGLWFCLIADHRSVQLEILLKEATKRIIEDSRFKPPKMHAVYGRYAFVDEVLDEIFASKNIEFDRITQRFSSPNED